MAVFLLIFIYGAFIDIEILMLNFKISRKIVEFFGFAQDEEDRRN